MSELREQGPADLAELFQPWLKLGFDFGSPLRKRLFTPARTFWLFLSQVLSADGSCREALQKFAAWLSGEGLGKISEDTSGYCQARKRLSRRAIAEAHECVKERIEKRVSGRDLWLGRVVKVFDGSCLSMPDTAANQRAWPQQRGQKAGCGFPVMRVVVLFSLFAGALLDLAQGDYYTSEMTLFRRLWGSLKAGEVILGDRGFWGYAAWFLLVENGVDLVLRKPERRAKKPKVIERLGKHDRIVIWNKSAARPKWLSPEQWEEVWDSMPVREVRIFLARRGHRTRKLTIITSLLDPEKYPAAAIAELYRRRWAAELYLCEIKVTMGMDILRCKTPELVEKELAMRVIAYNLVRALMLEAALSEGAILERISFKGTVSALRSWAPVLAQEHLTHLRRGQIYGDFLYYLARDLVPLRPGRREPRAKKRRPKPYQLLTKPRHQFLELPHRGKRKRA
jgi:hypothetical protein